MKNINGMSKGSVSEANKSMVYDRKRNVCPPREQEEKIKEAKENEQKEG